MSALHFALLCLFYNFLPVMFLPRAGGTPTACVKCVTFHVVTKYFILLDSFRHFLSSPGCPAG